VTSGGGPPVRVTVMPSLRSSVCADPEWITAFSRHAEAVGVEAVALPEHAVLVTPLASRYPYSPSGRFPLPVDCALPDPIDTLAYVAATTTTLGLATGLLLVPLHNPLVLAKRLATVDRLSRGRLRLGAGLGWMREEFEACGVPFADRGRVADESIDVLRVLWADSGEDGASFAGEFFSFSGVHSHPRPFRPSGVPVHVGGNTPAAIRRAARRGDGWQPLGLGDDELHAGIELLRREATAAGRDPGAIEISLSGFQTSTTSLETLERAAAHGACRVVANCVPRDLAGALDDLSALAERVGLVAPAAPPPAAPPAAPSPSPSPSPSRAG
jgi:probable F420-dependent oxidoreductase